MFLMNTIAYAYDPSAIKSPVGHWIHGAQSDSGGAELNVYRPSDGQLHGTIREASADVVDAAVKSAKRGQVVWAELLPRKRAEAMHRWATLIDENRDEIARLESFVSSRPYREAEAADVPAVAEWIRFYGEYADKIEGQVTASGTGKLSLVLREPYGVVGIITPWNFPLFLSVWKIAPAIAAGNTVVIKASELTPWSIRKLAELATEAGLPDGVVNVIHGSGPGAGAQLVRHPDVSYVSFTGSTAVGARIMADASAHGVKPVSLELGGKSATIVFHDCGDLDTVADHVCWGITRNAGQLCYAGSRLVVDDAVAQPLLERIVQRMAALVPGPTWSDATTLPPIISRKQCDRISELVRKTCLEGAVTLCGAESMDIGGGSYFSPTVLDHISVGMTGYRNEIFGPVLCVQRFKNQDDAYALADHPVYGLSASVFTQDINKAMRMARHVKAGTVWINRWGRTPEMMTSPFGGYGQSGFGKESGRAGLEGFLRSKSVWTDFGGIAELSQGGRP